MLIILIVLDYDLNPYIWCLSELGRSLLEKKWAIQL